MQLLEGQAYFPETREEIEMKGKANYISKIFEMEPPMMANGTEANEGPLSGNEVGSSDYAIEHAKKLWGAIKENGDKINRKFHGAGSRYIEEADGSDSLISKCISKLPEGAADPYLINVLYRNQYWLYMTQITIIIYYTNYYILANI